MIRFQNQRTKLPTGSAAARQGRTAAFVASAALIAHLLSACSIPLQSGSETRAAAQYPDLNDPTPNVAARADVAQLKAQLIQVRDNQGRAASQR